MYTSSSLLLLVPFLFNSGSTRTQAFVILPGPATGRLAAPSFSSLGESLRSSSSVLFAAAPRKRSKIRIGDEEMSFFFDDEEGEEGGGGEEGAGWEGQTVMEEEEDDDDDEDEESPRQSSRRKRFASTNAAEAQQAKNDDPYYAYRDRRMFKMGEDERAYYDR